MNYHHFTIEERCCLREHYVKVPEKEIKACIKDKNSDIGKRIRLYRDKEKVKYVLPRLRKEKHAIILPLKFLTEKAKPWRKRSSRSFQSCREKQ